MRISTLFSSRAFFVTAIFLLFFTTISFAQKKKSAASKSSIHQKWELGLFLGVSQYQGDLQEYDLKELNLANGVLVRHHFNDNIALRGGFSFGRLSGYDTNYEARENRGFSFKGPVRELNIMAEYDILGKRRFKEMDKGKFTKTISPYVFGGVGFASISHDVNYNEANPALTSLTRANIILDRKATTNKGSLVVPMGLGVKMDISKMWTLALEGSLRLTFSDYVDGVSKVGNPDKNDTYGFAGLTLSYRIPHIKDADKDGVADEIDACPEIAGPLKSKGCPDKDNDGVGDKFDNCPESVGLKSLNGCPDADRDGITDAEDACPDVIGLKDLKGCPDTDEDGVADKDDECPSEKGIKEYNGCAFKDTDNDGTEDKLDKCPSEKGPKNNNGCPLIDTDKDGVADINDACPDKAGEARFKGCPDTDKDGIDDSQDKCPDVAGVSFNQGCPEIKQADKEILQNAIYGVEFELGSAKITKNSSTILDNVVTVLQKYPEYTMSIGGHTDNVGAEKINQTLSTARAKSCFDYFVEKGVLASRMNFVGYGSTIPVGENKTPAGRAKNRRVEFQLFVK